MNAFKGYFGVVGLLSLAGAAFLLARRIQVLLSGRKIEGTVVAHDVRASDDSVFHHPVIAFVDAEGREHRFTSVAGSTAKRPRLGASVTIRYLASNPKQAYISTFLHMWAGPLALIVIGAAGCAAFIAS